MNRFLIGDAFVEITIPECQELIEEKLATFEKQLDDYQAKIDDANEQMTRLKAILYGKFGKYINYNIYFSKTILFFFFN